MESQEEHLDRRLPSSLNTSINTRPCNFFHSEPIDKPGTSPAKDTYPELHDAIVTEGFVTSVSSFDQVFNSICLV